MPGAHIYGRLVPSDEALSISLVLTGNSALAVHMAKVLLNGQSEMSTAVALALESTSQAVLYDDPEKHERMGAFLDRRAARAREKGIDFQRLGYRRCLGERLKVKQYVNQAMQS